jgi:hypothetical protein
MRWPLAPGGHWRALGVVLRVEGKEKRGGGSRVHAAAAATATASASAVRLKDVRVPQ